MRWISLSGLSQALSYCRGASIGAQIWEAEGWQSDASAAQLQVPPSKGTTSIVGLCSAAQL